MAWQDIATSEIAAGAPITQELLAKLDLRDKAVIEGPAGGRWAEQTTDALTPIKFLTLFVPRGASAIYFECMAGVSTPGEAPSARIYITDGVTTSFGEFVSFASQVIRTRLAFPPVPVPAALRGALVSCYFDAEDSLGSAGLFAIENDTTSVQQGFGVRFGGPIVELAEVTTAPVTTGTFLLDPLYIPGIPALPAAGAAHHRKIYVLRRGDGLEDYLCICLKGHDDAYRWIIIGQGGP